MTPVTIFAVDQIADGVRAYFADASRTVAAEVVVDEWKTQKHYGRPIVVIGVGPLRYVGAAAFPPGFRWAPGAIFEIDADHKAPVVGARLQTFTVWAHGGAIDFTSAGTDRTVAEVQARKDAFALSDLTYSALRDIHGHDITAPGKPVDDDAGEFVYGSVLTWAFEIPVPVLGDVFDFIVADELDSTVTGTTAGVDAVPGDTIVVPTP